MRVWINRILFLVLLLLIFGAVLSALFKKDSPNQEPSSVVAVTPTMVSEPQEQINANSKPTLSEPAQGVGEATSDPDTAEINLLLTVYDSSVTFESYVQQLSSFIISKGLPELAAKKLATLIVTQARTADIDPLVLGSIVFVFSKFDQQNDQNGRKGLMFLSEEQAQKICKRESVVCEAEVTLSREDSNLFLGTLEIKNLAQANSGDLALVLASYLFGETPEALQAAGTVEIQQLAALIRSSINEINAMSKVPMKQEAVPVPVQESFKAEPNNVAAIDTESVPTAEQPTVTQAPVVEINAKSFITMSIDSTNRNPQELEAIVDLLVKKAEEQDLDPLLIAAIAWTISSLNPQLQGSDGKVGLMQLNPKQGEYIAGLTETPWKPEQLSELDYNVTLATKYVQLLMGIFDRKLEGVLTAYHWDVKQLTEVGADSDLVPPGSINFSNQVKETYQNWQHEYQLFTKQ